MSTDSPQELSDEGSAFDAWWRQQNAGLGTAHMFTAWNAWLARSEIGAQTNAAADALARRDGPSDRKDAERYRVLRRHTAPSELELHANVAHKDIPPHQSITGRVDEICDLLLSRSDATKQHAPRMGPVTRDRDHLDPEDDHGQ